MATLASLRHDFVYADTPERYQGIAIGALDLGDNLRELASRTLPWLHQRLTLLHAARRLDEAQDLHYLITQIEKIR